MDRERFDRQVKDHPEIPLEQRKAEFLEATRQIDLLAPLRSHPWLTVGTALVAGISAGAPHLGSKVQTAKSSLTFRILKNVGMRAAQYFVAARAAKAHAAAMAATGPEPTQASA